MKITLEVSPEIIRKLNALQQLSGKPGDAVVSTFIKGIQNEMDSLVTRTLKFYINGGKAAVSRSTTTNPQAEIYHKEGGSLSDEALPPDTEPVVTPQQPANQPHLVQESELDGILDTGPTGPRGESEIMRLQSGAVRDAPVLVSASDVAAPKESGLYREPMGHGKIFREADYTKVEKNDDKSFRDATARYAREMGLNLNDLS